MQQAKKMLRINTQTKSPIHNVCSIKMCWKHKQHIHTNTEIHCKYRIHIYSLMMCHFSHVSTGFWFLYFPVCLHLYWFTAYVMKVIFFVCVYVICDLGFVFKIPKKNKKTERVDYVGGLHFSRSFTYHRKYMTIFRAYDRKTSTNWFYWWSCAWKHVQTVVVKTNTYVLSWPSPVHSN